MRRLTITGSSGYLGSRLAQTFREGNAELTIQGIDVVPPAESAGVDRFDQVDVCSSDIARVLAEFQPDTVIHSAFAFQLRHDVKAMRRINVAGTRNLLAAAAARPPARLLVMSSATAYGAAAENPVPMSESWPVATASRFSYADDKMTVERLLADFAAAQPNIRVSWVRPAIVAGPGMDNYLSRFIFGMPFLLQLDGHDTPLQFVHEQDLLRAVQTVLNHDGSGPYNVGPGDPVAISKIGEETNRPVFRIPFSLARALHGLAWWLRIPIHESPASFLDFARYPWVVASSRLEGEFGFRFQYTGLETLRETIRHRRKGNSS